MKLQTNHACKSSRQFAECQSRVKLTRIDAVLAEMSKRYADVDGARCLIRMQIPVNCHPKSVPFDVVISLISQ